MPNESSGNEPANWPQQDPDIHETVRQAFVEYYPGMLNLFIYHVALHDHKVNSWTASVSANEFNKPTWYFQVYFNGEYAVFLSLEPAPDNL